MAQTIALVGPRESGLAMAAAEPGTFIVNVTEMSGRITKLRVSKDMTVKQVREMFGSYHNLSVYHFKFIHRAKHMKDEKTLNYYNVTPDCVINLAVRSGGPVHVMEMSGTKIKLSVSKDMTVKQLKEMFGEYHNLSYDVVKLVYKAKHMNNEMKLDYYNLIPDCVIQFTERSRGGGHSNVIK